MPANLSDKNLEDVVHKELKKPEGPLTKGDLKSLGVLSAGTSKARIRSRKKGAKQVTARPFASAGMP
jgi:hypothetical protein